MKVNNTLVKGTSFAYDGCHKIYVCENKEDAGQAVEADYCLLPIEALAQTYQRSCPLRFISNWALTKMYAEQGEDAVIN